MHYCMAKVESAAAAAIAALISAVVLHFAVAAVIAAGLRLHRSAAVARVADVAVVVAAHRPLCLYSDHRNLVPPNALSLSWQRQQRERLCWKTCQPPQVHRLRHRLNYL